MSDKNLSGEEKRKLLKEQYKKELRERKEFVSKVKNLRQMQRINKALAEMTAEDDTDEWIRKLNEETAFTEAKMEIALDTTLEDHKEQELEEELKEIVAESMVEELKDGLKEEPKTNVQKEIPKEEEDEGPEKTLGDFGV